MKTILFSTTRQYNPGDEFILMGIENLLKESGAIYNTVIANRNPMIDKVGFRVYKDNSFDFKNWELIDYVIFAGSPVWWQCKSRVYDICKSLKKGSFVNTVGRFLNINRSFVTDSIYSGILKYDKKCSFLGIGSGRDNYNFDHKVSEVMNNHTDLIIVRNQNTLDSIPAEYSPILQPCPALFSSQINKKVSSLKKILFILQDVNIKMKYDGLTESVLRYSLDQYAVIKKEFEYVRVACFAWQDYAKLSKHLSKNEIIYNFRAESWPCIISDYDLIVSTRVHGCGLASSVGIPNIMIRKGFRTDTVKLFNSLIVEPGDNIASIIKSTDLESYSSKLNNYKCDCKKQWISLLRDKLPFICN